MEVDELVFEAVHHLQSSSLRRTRYGRELLNAVKEISILRWSDETQSASMQWRPNGDRILRLNRSFFREYVEHPERKQLNTSFVILHEISHHLRSDFFRCVRNLNLPWREISNLILDIYVNSSLFRHGFPPGETVTADLYSTEDLSFLLLPPHALLEQLYGSGENPEDMKLFVTCPEQLWKPFSVQEYENSEPSAVSGKQGQEDPIINNGKAEVIHQLVETVFPAMREQCSAFGNESPRSEKENRRLFRIYLKAWFGELLLEEFVHRLDDLVQFCELPREIGCLVGDGTGGSGRGTALNRDRWSRGRSALRRAEFIRMVRNALAKPDQTQEPVRRQVKQPGVVPAMDRRSSFLVSSGTWPVFFQNRVQVRDQPEKVVYLYLDSSGSMTDEIVDLIVELMLGASGLISTPPYLFASEVEPVELEELQEGKRLTGGTSAEAVLDHAREKNRSRLILVTDGHVEKSFSPRNQSFLKRVDLYTLFTGGEQQPLADLSTKYWKNIRAKLT